MTRIARIFASLGRARNPLELFATLEEPIRYEIFSPERLEEHAKELAAKQKVIADPSRGLRLAPRVLENGRIIRAANQAVAVTVREQRAITPAAEWLLDNFHIVDDHLRDIQDTLPAGYYRELPKLSGGPLRGYPRVYEISWSFVAHTDSHFDPELLIRFVRAYQQVQTLSIGELWAIPITLRIVLIENLRRLSVRIVSSQQARLEADQVADDLLGITAGSRPIAEDILQEIDKQPLQREFVVQLIQRIRHQGSDVSAVMQDLTERLEAQGTNPDEIVLQEHSLQAGANVSVRNIITSMRGVSAHSWNSFFEKVSMVDEALHVDPLYGEMDFITRDRYRHGIEELAKGAHLDELDIVRLVIAKTDEARRKAGEMSDWRQMDPGFYLISKGRRAFEKEIGFRPSLLRTFLRAYTDHATPAYLGSIAVVTLLLALLPVSSSSNSGVMPYWLLLLGMLALFPASDIAVMLINKFMTAEIGPRHLPRLELANGIPPSLRTVVAVPTFLLSDVDAEEQIKHLEVHYLANPDGDVRFALLTDWPDADSETVAGESELLRFAARRIEQLNACHGTTPDGETRFFIFHRKRLWNEREHKWMGWERKRGKLHEFNRLLRGARDTSYIAIDGTPPEPPSNVRYVITLDADTKIPTKTVRELVGSMAHPLNLPRIDERTGRVVEGYGILQPRIIPSFPTWSDRTLFHHIFSGPCGFDPYASAISDIYQDLFGEGSFTGKGIYDVDAFEVVLAGRVPENSVLSHDLFEGTFARCGLASDIALFEEFPSDAEVAASRNHRWVRGDWQLLPWICGKRGAEIPVIGRWKMIDNLRRSLSAPAMLILLSAVWLIPALPSSVWVLLVLANIAFPAFLTIIPGLLPHRRGISITRHLRAVLGDLLAGAGHIAVSLTLLAHQAWQMTDAIVRTLVRLFITRRNLLQWMTAATAKKESCHSYGYFFRRMSGSYIIALVLLLLTILCAPGGLPVALPFILLWFASPLVAWWISCPPATGPIEVLPEEEVTLFRLTARRTWRFFTTFVTAEDHWLPPDNFQEEPHPVIAHRSSPTNFGLYLLAVVAARDFGWIGVSETVERLHATMETLEELPRFHGHFYNWYETTELRTLEPKYISSVDSGNCAGHLLALSQACMEMKQSPLLSAAALKGIGDTLCLVHDALLELGRDTAVRTLCDAAGELESRIADAPGGYFEQALFMGVLEAEAETFTASLRSAAQESGTAGWSEAVAWGELLLGDIRSHRRDVDTLFPWVRILDEWGRGPQGAAEGEQESLKTIRDLFEPDIPLGSLSECCEAAAGRVALLKGLTNSRVQRAGIDTMIEAFDRSGMMCHLLAERLDRIAASARNLFDDMDFSFLYDQGCHLFSIGYSINDGHLDRSFYDLLASEARLTSYIAVAKGEAPPSHWFRLSRTLTPVKTGAALVSWSGSMFEYLMPSLVMSSPRGTILDQTCRLVVDRQIDYGKENGVPWGISESAYSTRDLSFTYQYSDFGIPGLGLKRGLGQDLVIAPYATVLASMYAPAAAAHNLRQIDTVGGRGRYGFYEALDFTRERLPEGVNASVVRAYMAHHQGMSLLALDNVIHDGIMRRRFHREPMIHAAELLLQERVSRDVNVARPLADQVQGARVREAVQAVLRRFNTPNHRLPSTHLLSNGRYAVMITAAGSGYSHWGDLAVTRWREDVTRDSWGSYLFMRDTDSGLVWSATYQPVCAESEQYEVVFGEDRARIVRRIGTLSSTMEIIVSPEDDAELRRLSIVNRGTSTREIEVTSYAEVVLAPQNADIAHPAFSNLFVQTEYVSAVSGLLACRRPRSAASPAVWAAHVVGMSGADGIEYETDRMRFIGRAGTIRRPVAIMDGRPLSNTVGPVLDPIFTLRTRVRVAPGTTTHIVFSTMVAPSREAALLLADKYHDPASFERISTLAWSQAQIQLHYLGIERGEAHLFQHLANRMLYADPAMRSRDELLRLSTLTVTGLWKYGISGDYPIALLRIDDISDQGIVRQLLRAHEYWRLKLLPVDLVILNEQESSYIQELQHALEGMVNTSLAGSRPLQESRGRILVLRADLMTGDERLLLQTAARAVLSARDGSLTEQVVRMRRQEQRTVHPARRQLPRHPAEETVLVTPQLEFFNGFGGFAEGGREYVIILGKGLRTPAPWINVIANERFGFQVSESGAGYSWSLNSRENQLTPWSNDPVGDPPGEVLYICDRDSGATWCPTALPIRVESAAYIARHGYGYSNFEHLSHGIGSTLVQFVAQVDPVKISLLVLENRSKMRRQLSITAYLEWVLGFSRTVSVPYIVTEIDEETGALFARNPWNAEFGDRVAFADLGGRQTSWSANRIEFIGRNGTLEQPAGLIKGTKLSGRTGAGLDACAALQTTLVLDPGERVERFFILGQAADRESARALVEHWRTADLRQELAAVREQWERQLGTVEVTTPDRSMDIMLNGWFLYQTMVCRFTARSAFYQAGGAYGFRDQLQDCMALVMIDPALVRTHLVRASGRQFREGDVQHWWHPPTGRGVRTRISDDLLWLPYVVSHYLAVTEDRGILDEQTPFLEGDAVPAGHEDAYFEPAVSEESATLFEHCARALDLRLATGEHGLPLMGTGDWNDGMNRVGDKGFGESIWLGWFLYAALSRFAPLAAERGEGERAEEWLAHAGRLQEALEMEAWDGAWYRRAYYDDGTPLGSAGNSECRIDSIAQSWAVISGAADHERSVRAMKSVDEYLVRPGDDQILLFTPPFDKSPQDPGYIKGYLPGIRENGGQYTHAAAWCVIAFAMLGNGDKAHELFSMLNPLTHGSTRSGVLRFRVEPYVAVADVYSEQPHTGRGGWSWYTGSAAWLYQAGVEHMLGFAVQGNHLRLDPCIPSAWPAFDITYRHGTARYEIAVTNPNGVMRGIIGLELDGEPLPVAEKWVPLQDDGRKHVVRLIMGSAVEKT